jgi:hypothetical protein
MFAWSPSTGTGVPFTAVIGDRAAAAQRQGLVAVRSDGRTDSLSIPLICSSLAQVYSQTTFDTSVPERGGHRGQQLDGTGCGV